MQPSSPSSTGATDEHRWGYAGWRVAVAASVGVFVSFASLLVYTFGVFLKPIAAEFGWSREAVSAAFGIAAMSAAVASPMLGHLFDRLEPRRIIVPALVIFGSAFASLSLLTPHLWQLYVTFAVLGLVANGTAQMAYVRAVSSWFDRRRGVALAFVMAGGAVGSIVLPPIAEALIQGGGWRRACQILGAMVLVIGVPVVVRFVRQRPAALSSLSDSSSGASLREGLTSRVFWILVVVLFLSSIAQNGAITHAAALLTDRGVTPSGAALAMAAMGAASLTGRLVTGWLMDRFPAARVSIALLLIAAAGTFLLSSAGTLMVGVAATVMIGFGMGGEADITPYLLSRHFGLRAFATLYGFTWTAYAIAGAIGPVLMGKAFDATGSYDALLVMLAVSTVGAALLMLAMPPVRAQEHQP